MAKRFSKDEVIKAAKAMKGPSKSHGEPHKVINPCQMCVQWDRPGWIINAWQIVPCFACNQDNQRGLDKPNLITEVRVCACGSGLEARQLLDARGIYVARVCDACEQQVRAKYRPEIFTESQYDLMGEEEGEDLE